MVQYTKKLFELVLYKEHSRTDTHYNPIKLFVYPFYCTLLIFTTGDSMTEINEFLAPTDFAVEEKDSAVTAKWKELDCADGYILSFYKADNAEKCIKTRRADIGRKTVLGFTNGVKYLVDICAFRLVNGKEVCGAKSKKLAFTPISNVLKAQRFICLRSGEQKKLKWEYKNTVPDAVFSSSDSSIASVADDGTITAVSAGETTITTTASESSFDTRVKVDRRLYSRNDTAVLMLTGDLMCTARQQRAVKERGFDFNNAFSAVKHILNGADCTVGVLETTCSDSSPFECEELRTEKGSPNCNSPSTFVSALKEAGFNALVTANNHNCDTGLNGLNDTIDAVRRVGIKNIGTIDDNPVYITVSCIKIAFIAVCMVFNGTENELTDIGVTKEMLGRYSPDFFRLLTEKAKSCGADYIIAYQHWGNMNSTQISRAQINAAQEMADCGADLIIGSHPHVMQRFDIITAADGRKVPCAFSLGNCLTTMSEVKGNRESAIIRAELTRKGNTIAADISYIPVYSADNEGAATITPLSVPVNAEQAQAYRCVENAIGKKIKPFAAHPKIILSGSAVLGKIFEDSEEYGVSREALILSQLTVSGTPKESADKNDAPRVKLDVEKSFDRYIASSAADYIVLDFYTAASLSCYKLGECYYTASESFRKSSFYQRHEKEFTLVSQPIDESVWKAAIDVYAHSLLSRFSSEQIILVKLQFSDMCVNGGELRNRKSFGNLNKRIGKMEDYFYSLVKPVVIDISNYYFADASGTSISQFEPFFYEHMRNILREIILKRSEKTYYGLADPDIRMKRILRYYDNASARAYFDRLCDKKSAASLLIRYTTREFTAENSDYLKELFIYKDAELTAVKRIFKDREGAAELIKAAEAVNAVLKGDISKQYSFYSIIFKRSFAVRKQFAALLSKCPECENITITPENAETIFILRDNPENLNKYVKMFALENVDIWGSCISREAVNRNPSLHVSSYIFKQPQVLTFEPPINCEVPDDVQRFCNNKWRMRTIADSFSRNGIQTLCDNSKWLIVDFYDLICNMVLYNGQLFEIDDFIERTDFYRSIKNLCKPAYLFREKTKQFCADSILHFAEFVDVKYGANVILIKADLKTRYIGLDGKLHDIPNSRDTAEKQEFIEYFENRFAELTDCYIVDISKHFYSSDSFPHGGAHIVHYEDEFYTEACAIISDIIINGSGKHIYDKADEQYLFMRDVKLNATDNNT